MTKEIYVTQANAECFLKAYFEKHGKPDPRNFNYLLNDQRRGRHLNPVPFVKVRGRILYFIKTTVLIFLVLAMPIAAQASEKATYVGDGRYVGEGKSVDDAALRQRNNERQERQYGRQRTEDRYDRAERYERESEYEQRGREWSEY